MFMFRIVFILFFSFNLVFLAEAKDRQTNNSAIAQNILRNHQDDIHLKNLLEKLLSQNPEIKSLSYKIAAAKNSVSQAPWLDDLTVGIDAVNLPTGNPSLSRTPMSGVQISAQQKVPFPSKLITKKRIAKAKLGAVQKAYLENINQLITKFKQSYYEYAYTQAAIYVHGKNKKRLIALKTILQAKYTTGAIPLQDLLKIKISIGDIDNSLIALRQLSKTHQVRLNTYLSQNIHDKINYSTKRKLSPLPKDMDKLVLKSKTARPWLQKLDYDVQEKQKVQSLAKQSLLPDFNFKASYRVRNNVAGDPVNGENFVSSGVSVNLPFLWSLPKHTKKISETKNLLRAKKHEKQAVAQEVKYQVSQYYLDAKRLKKQYYITSGKIVPASKAAFNSSKSSYEAGEVDFLDVITAQNSLFSHELSSIRYKYDYEIKHALLEMAVGEFF